jgi:hypothetical protein
VLTEEIKQLLAAADRERRDQDIAVGVTGLREDLAEFGDRLFP